MADPLTANDTPPEAAGGHPPTWYDATAPALAPFPPLAGEAEADLCVVGGGLTGLSAALHAARAGARVVLLEARRVGWGASGRNGGQAGGGQRIALSDLESRMGPEAALAAWRLGDDARDLVRTLAHETDALWRPGLAHLEESARAADAAAAEAAHVAARTGAAFETLDAAGAARLTGSARFAGGVLDRASGHLHPLRLARGLARAAAAAGARIHEGTRATRLEGTDLLAGRARVRARRILLAGNGYLAGLAPAHEARLVRIANYVVATRPVPGLMAEDVAAHDGRFVVSYWRTGHDDRLIFGGGESYGARFPKNIGAVVRPPLERVYPQLKGIPFDHAWGGTLAITVPRLPHLAEDGALLFAGGYSGHGVGLSLLVGRAAAAKAGGDGAEWDALAAMRVPPVPGGALGRRLLAPAGMAFYALRDRIGA